MPRLVHSLSLTGLVLAGLSLSLVGAGAANPPSPPADLAAQSGGNSEVPLTWSPSPGATSYDIYRSTTQNDTHTRRVATGVTGTSHRSAGLKNDSTYYFRLKAVNAAGASAFSAEVAATTQVTGLPLPDGVYTLAPKDAPARRLHAGAAVREADRSTAQQWRLTGIDGTAYRLSPVSAPGQVLGDTPTALWKPVPVAGGYRLLAATDAHQALQNGGDTAAAAPVSEAPAQVWNILPPASTGGGARDPGTAFVPAGYRLAFSDEFDGTGIDLQKWEPLAPYSQPHLNDEMENYLPEAVTLAQGHLVLTAEPHESTCLLAGKEPAPHCRGRHAWRSGAITSRATFTHGYFEARLKLPQGAGLWPAFWLTSSKRWPPEWDIVEIPYPTGTLFQYMHPTRQAKLTWLGGASGGDSAFTPAEGMPNPYEGYVVYGCEVTATEVKLWVDGRLTGHWQVSADMEDPMWVSLNLAVGGKWPGPPDANTPRPAAMVVDYLRIYQPPSAGAADSR